jgi:hypothetical protein
LDTPGFVAYPKNHLGGWLPWSTGESIQPWKTHKTGFGFSKKQPHAIQNAPYMVL